MLHIVNISTESGTHPSATIGGPPGACSSATIPAVVVNSPLPPSPIDFPSLSDDGHYAHKSPKEKSSGKWSEIRKSGVIKMTPYVNSSRSVKNFVFGYDHIRPLRNVRAFQCSVPPASCLYYNDILVNTRYTEQGDLGYWGFIVPDANKFRCGSYDEILKDFIVQTQNAAIMASNSGYDLLTEIAESKKTFSFLSDTVKKASASYKDLLKGIDSRQLAILRGMNYNTMTQHAERFVKLFARRWLEFRYAIMPLYYSYKDITGLLDRRGNTYHTVHRSKVLSLDLDSEKPRGSSSIFEKRVGDLKVTSTVKTRYDVGGLRSILTDGLILNPFGTAWELIPFSFVLDFFINIGDWVSSATRIDCSLQKAGCTAIRIKSELSSVLSFVNTYNYSFSRAASPCYPAITYNYVVDDRILKVLRTEKIDSYERFLFNPNESVTLRSDFSLSWKQWLDIVALGVSPSLKYLKGI